MLTTQTALPEELVIATLHRVGVRFRLEDSARLTEIFGAEAANPGSPFAAFKVHPHYQFSTVLSDTLQILDHAGEIVRENAAQWNFRVSTHTAGQFGKNIYERLEPSARSVVDELANKIKAAFGGPDGP